MLRLEAILSPFWDIKLVVECALYPTLKAVWRDPSLILHPRRLSRLFFAHVWAGGFANGVDAAASPSKEKLIRPNAKGVVLDIGAGHGHTLLYLDRERVSKYIAVEPNEGMHPEIRKAASAAGYDELKDEFLILSCGAEHVDQITRATGGENKVDTIVSVLTLCSIPEPQQAISAMVNRLLKPGGQFLLYEHVRSPRTDVSFWQSVWTPVWSIFFDGCKLDRPTDLWVEKLGGWKESIIWGKEGESQERLFIHRLGRFVKE